MRGARSLGDEVRSGQKKQQDAVVGAVGWWSNAGVGGVCVVFVTAAGWLIK